MVAQLVRLEEGEGGGDFVLFDPAQVDGGLSTFNPTGDGGGNFDRLPSFVPDAEIQITTPEIRGTVTPIASPYQRRESSVPVEPIVATQPVPGIKQPAVLSGSALFSDQTPGFLFQGNNLETGSSLPVAAAEQQSGFQTRMSGFSIGILAIAFVVAVVAAWPTGK